MPSVKQLNILFVDDDHALAASFAELLGEQGHQATVAGNGVQAIEQLRQASFDLVITDILMPDKEGIELIMEIMKDFPGLPIIAISGGGRIGADNYLDMAVKLGCHAGLRKPFTSEQLFAAINAAMADSE